jgi:hypothetical protein
MAAIGWRSLDGTLSFGCGGSLISERLNGFEIINKII